MQPRPMEPIAITAWTATTAVGTGNRALTDALVGRRTGLRVDDYTEPATGVHLPCWIGRVAGLEAVVLPEGSSEPDSRNNRLAWHALRQDGFLASAEAAIARYGAARVGLLIGTSTSTIEASEIAYREHHRDPTRPVTLAGHHLHATTGFIRDRLGVRGPCATVSTACSSSAKVFAQAARLIALGLVDAAIVGGVDSLAASTLFGFNALGLISSMPCRPFDARRDGISIGEAAGFALLERISVADDGLPLLIGYGESSDAHHLSAPHPEGRGARDAIEAALARAGLVPAAVDYINLHGTATPKNDAVEAALVAGLFPASTDAGSTKGWTGHTLGAAGIVEAIVTLIAMQESLSPGTLNAEERDPVCGPQIRFEARSRDIDIALSHAFAFGGSNCVLAFARDAAGLKARRA